MNRHPAGRIPIPWGGRPTKTQTTTIPRRPALAATCLLSLALAIGGCGGRSPGQSHDQGQEEDHAGHTIPAHKPRSFPEAVRRLRELNGQIAREASGGKTLGIALDVANWLPEIAADSDMPEARWNEVDSRSGVLVAAYRKILEGATTDARALDNRAALGEADGAIASLEKLLAASDPRWFGKPKP